MSQNGKAKSMDLRGLIRGGFARAANFELNARSVAALSNDLLPDPGVYLFVVDDDVRYVGVASRGLDRRLKSYLRRQHRIAKGEANAARANRPVHRGLKGALASGELVEVYIRAIQGSERLMWGGLPVNVLHGVEAALIDALHPAWNRRGRKAGADKEDAGDRDEDEGIG